VLLVEQGDVGGGTSAASTRLIHGGLRYLEHAEIGLVRESLHERERLLRLAPHLVTPLKLCLPIYRGGARKAWQIRAGMCLYDLLSAGKSVPRHRMLGRDELLEELPGLAAASLRGGAEYHDAQVAFPERLVLENVLDAVAHGTELRTYTRATRIIAIDGRARGIEWRRRDGTRGRADADIIVNASGPWVDRVVGDLATRKLIGGTKGSHVISTPFPGAPAHAVYAEAAGDARPFFVVPWNGLYLIGTTDERYVDDPGEARTSMAEYRYLIAAAERLFPSAAPLEHRVCYTQAGVRPLPQTSKSRTGAITRSHIIHEHRNARGLYSIIGGKLTTHRALAEDVLRRVRRRLGVGGESASRERGLRSFEQRFWNESGGHLHDVVDVDHVRMVQLARRARLPIEAFLINGEVAGGKIAGQNHFQGDGASNLRILGLEDGAHRSPPDFFQDFVAADALHAIRHRWRRGS